jgi:DnaA-like protein
MSQSMRKAMIREDLVNLTGDFRSAVVLNQLFYWTQLTCDIHKLLQSEYSSYLEHNPVFDQGWIIKSAQELCEETMLGLSRQTMRIILRDLVTAGWLQESLLGKYKNNKTTKYRLNLVKIQKDLDDLGYDSNAETFSPKLLDFQRLEPRATSAPSVKHQILNLKRLHVTNLTYNVKNLTSKNPQTLNSQHLHVSNLTCNVMNLTFKCSLKIGSQSRTSIGFSENQKTLNVDKPTITALPESIKQQNSSDFGLKFSTTQNPSLAHARAYNIYKYNINNIYTLSPFPSLSENLEFESTAKNEREIISQKMIQIFSEVVLNGQVLKLYPARAQKLQSVLTEQFNGDLESWRTVCQNVTRSKFLMGEAKTSNFKAGLDWLLEKRNATKVFEGAYGVGDRAVAPTQPKLSSENPSQTIDVQHEHQDMKELCLWFIQQFGASDYNTWFKDAAFQGFDGQRFEITVPSTFIRDQITCRFASYIWEFLRDKYKKRINLEISIKPNPLTASSPLTTNEKEKRP